MCILITYSFDIHFPAQMSSQLNNMWGFSEGTKRLDNISHGRMYVSAAELNTHTCVPQLYDLTF